MKITSFFILAGVASGVLAQYPEYPDPIAICMFSAFTFKDIAES
jgi:hypothetical protein